MRGAMREDASRTEDAQPACRRLQGDFTMMWETPTAIDFRFGMEITMYISNR